MPIKRPCLVNHQQDEYSYRDYYRDDIFDQDDIGDEEEECGSEDIEPPNHVMNLDSYCINYLIREEEEDESNAIATASTNKEYRDTPEENESESKDILTSESFPYLELGSNLIDLDFANIDIVQEDSRDEDLHAHVEDCEEWSNISDIMSDTKSMKSWNIVPGTDSIISFNTSISFSYKDAILMKKNEEAGNICNFKKNIDEPQIPATHAKLELDVGDARAGLNIIYDSDDEQYDQFDPYFIREGQKYSRGKGSTHRVKKMNRNRIKS